MATNLSKLVFWSSIGRKVVLALSGLAIFMFVFIHFLGNVTLFLNRPDLFNQYAYMLHRTGVLLYVAEIMLVSIFLVHVVYAVAVTLENWRARGTAYYQLRNAGKPSRKNIASKTMIYTGILISIFIGFHLVTFKYGPAEKEGYVYQVREEGKVVQEMRDVHRLVKETFKDKWFTILYVTAMLIMGFHLWHAFGSAFESLGFEHPFYTPVLFGLGILLTLMLAGGFIAIPIWIYFVY